MQWTKPDFEEISLNMEVTAYVNTEEASKPSDTDRPREPQS
jgi:coenzyme PQQ precursor peptide PqqA